jgi:hypothetical protein
MIVCMPCRKLFLTLQDLPFTGYFNAMALASSQNSTRRRKRRKISNPSPLDIFIWDIAKVRTAEGKIYLFVAIDRVSKFAYEELIT